jgi:hypothetical protein
VVQHGIGFVADDGIEHEIAPDELHDASLWTHTTPRQVDAPINFHQQAGTAMA